MRVTARLRFQKRWATELGRTWGLASPLLASWLSLHVFSEICLLP